jgi:hypothetical protein
MKKYWCIEKERVEYFAELIEAKYKIIEEAEANIGKEMKRLSEQVNSIQQLLDGIKDEAYGISLHEEDSCES